MRIRLLFFKVLICAFSALSLLFLVEWVLAVMGFTVEEPLPISYPSNYVENEIFPLGLFSFCTESAETIYAPSPCQYDKNGFGITERLGGRVNKEWLKRETKLEVSLKLWAEKNELPYLNLTPTFKVANGIRPGKFHYKLNGHWTAMGNNLAATTILDWMKKNEMVPKTDRENPEIAQVTTTRVFEQTP